MSVMHDLSFLLRSRSLRFMQDAKLPAAGAATPSTARGLGHITWNGQPVYYRPHTSDCLVIYEVLLRSGAKAEYALPSANSVRTVLDIGGNIGAASLYLAQQFPNATIHTFEPVPANFEILKRNVAPHSRIKPHPVALGSENGELTMFGSDSAQNHGGFSFYDKGVNTNRQTTVPMRHAQEYLKEQGIAAPDVIKIDTEGAEYSILKALDATTLQRVQWIVGELHGEKDFDLLAYLSQWFDIGMHKNVGNRLFTFNAKNVTL